MTKEEMKLVLAIKSWIKNTSGGFSEMTSYRELMSLIEERNKKLKKRPTKVLHGPKNLEDHYTCFYCNLAHKQVEAGGMWACPNVTCTGPGAHSHRAKMISYKENDDGTHTVDTQDWLNFSRAYLLENEVDADLRSAIELGIKRLETNITSGKFGL